jgi:hypothetical protein
MFAGLPGTGLGGLFYALLVCWMPFRELWLLARGAAAMAAGRWWRAKVGLVLGIVAALWAEAWAIKWLVGSRSAGLAANIANGRGAAFAAGQHLPPALA